MTPHCKNCGGKMQRRGKKIWDVLGIGAERKNFYCGKCGSWDYSPPRHARPAKILLLDVETLPGEYYLWNPKQEYAQPEMQIKDWSISCWAAKWLFEAEVMGEVVSPKEAENRQDGRILEKIWKLVDEADIVVHHNGVRFDMPVLNTRWITNGYKPPQKYLNVDTYQTARSKFRFSYKRLDELAQKFGIGKKLEMHFDDWRGCLEGDTASRKEYLEHQLIYCKNDIAPLLEDVYLYLLPWMDGHPNMNVFSENDTEICRNCASTNISWGGKFYPTPQGLWDSWSCKSCGASGRGTGKDHKQKGVKIK